MKRLVLLVAALFVVIGVASALKIIPDQDKVLDNPADTSIKNRPEIENIATETEIATDLDTPWSIAFLPDGSLLVTERGGQLSKITQGRKDTLGVLPSREIGEGGLMGLVLDPDFEKNHFIYVQYTYSGSGNDTLNRVARYILEGARLTEDKIIVDGIPGASNHNGGRIKFGPDGFLYITTGDAQKPSLAQNRNSLAGKILRVTRDGNPAPGNPFGTRIYSYGHRNAQGLAWNDDGKLWATEHGPSGLQSGRDELNLIENGKNYGWPEIEGDETRANMVSPVIHSGSSTWAPAGAVFLNGSIFFGGLRGSALYEYRISERKLIEHFKDKYGRIREVTTGPDGTIYITTSNRDGRGTPESSDDKIIRINPINL